MADARARVMVLVKAAPVLTQHLDETMCVAGARIDCEHPEWIRLHPVPFRDLESDVKFAKYQEVEVDLIRSKTDRRPESWTPIVDSIKVGRRLGTENAWSDRRELVGTLRAATMCELVEVNRSGSGPDTPTLAVVHVAGVPELIITERSAEQLTKWNSRAEGASARLNLFEDPALNKPPFEVVPWRFRYHYRCQADGCRGHEQTIVDWEVVALWRRVRNRENWPDLIRAKFVDELWGEGRSTVLFVGNQEQHPASFLVLGIFWPPDQAYQPRLGL
jgi:hypothetical protein